MKPSKLNKLKYQIKLWILFNIKEPIADFREYRKMKNVWKNNHD